MSTWEHMPTATTHSKGIIKYTHCQYRYPDPFLGTASEQRAVIGITSGKRRIIHL